LLALGNLPGELERNGWIALAAGTAADHGAAAALDRLASRLPQPAESVRAADADLLIVRGTLGFYAGRTTAAIADLRAAIRLARHGAAAAQLPRAHMQLAQLLLYSGEWDEALVHARTALSLVSGERRVWIDAQVHAALARLFGGRGEWQRSDEHLTAAAAAAAEAGTIEAVVTTRVAQAAVARARNDPEQVVKVLAPLVANTRLIPMATSLAWWPGLIEAMIDGGELARAAEQIELLDTAARQRGLNMQARIEGAALIWRRPGDAPIRRAPATTGRSPCSRLTIRFWTGPGCITGSVSCWPPAGAGDARLSTSFASPVTCSPERARNRS
jgi:tetratricopeptide (TPR) repeat protein